MRRRHVLATGAALLGLPARHAVAADRIRPVEFTTGSPTGGWFPVAAAMAEMTNRYYDGQPLSIVPSAGAVANVVRVGRGLSDLGISYAPFLRLGKQGNNEVFRTGYSDLRGVLAGTYNMLHFVVAQDSRVRKASDLKGLKPRLRVGSGPTGSTENFSWQEMLKIVGVTARDIEGWGGRIELLTTQGRSDGWMNRQLDLAVFFITPPAAAVTEMMNARPASILDIEEPVRNALVERWGYRKVDLPANTYPGQTEVVHTLGMPWVVFARAQTDETLIYRLVKSVHEGKERLSHVSASFRKWNPAEMHEGLGIDVHPGAARYYREAGLMR